MHLYFNLKDVLVCIERAADSLSDMAGTRLFLNLAFAMPDTS